MIFCITVCCIWVAKSASILITLPCEQIDSKTVSNQISLSEICSENALLPSVEDVSRSWKVSVSISLLNSGNFFLLLPPVFTTRCFPRQHLPYSQLPGPLMGVHTAAVLHSSILDLLRILPFPVSPTAVPLPR